MPVDELRLLIRQHGIAASEEEASRVLDALHTAGVVLRHADNIYLNPRGEAGGARADARARSRRSALSHPTLCPRPLTPTLNPLTEVAELVLRALPDTAREAKVRTRRLTECVARSTGA